MLAFTACGEYGSALDPLSTRPPAPNASAVRTIVPRLPGFAVS
jgi:hypothetical protein